VTTVVVMAKAPRLGQVKTRLEPLLTRRGCLALHIVLLHRVCEVAAAAALPTFVAYDPADALHEIAPLLPGDVHVIPQRGQDLGRRMSEAVRDVSFRTTGPVIVVGVDAPTLRPDLLLTAAAALSATTGAARADVVLGPALDGGYYLIGVRRAAHTAFAIDPALWGGPHVLAATRAQLATAGCSVHELPPLRDLDTPEDAAALLEDPSLPPAIRDCLRPIELSA
jgi:rSAM/selenodomain-associated transferase 1